MDLVPLQFEMKSLHSKKRLINLQPVIKEFAKLNGRILLLLFIQTVLTALLMLDAPIRWEALPRARLLRLCGGLEITLKLMKIPILYFSILVPLRVRPKDLKLLRRHSLPILFVRDLIQTARDRTEILFLAL